MQALAKTATAADDLVRLVTALAALGYRQTSGDRFTRDQGGVAAIDVVLPALRRRRRRNVTVGPITAVDAGGLSYALGQPPVAVTVDALLLDGSRLPAFDIRLPTLHAALALKAFAWADRGETRDAIDVHRLLVAAAVTGLTAEDWASTVSLRGAQVILRRDFGRVIGSGCKAAAVESGVRAMIAVTTVSVIGPPPSAAAKRC